ncbi:MAG: autotransporter strand-loop-strand O-heptosyltransferase [Smithella sp.]
MYKKINFHATFNEQTGYGIHATQLVRELEKLIPVGKNTTDGDFNITLADVVSAQHIKIRRPFPSILYSVWESTQKPQGFLDILKLYDQLWHPSEWERQCSIDDGINPDFIKTVPEGVDPNIFKPVLLEKDLHFNFLIVGKWEHRKATKEMIKFWLEVFEGIEKVRLYVASDNPFPVDKYRTTEERLSGYGLDDARIKVVHFQDKKEHVETLQRSHVFLSCSRAEGWNLPLIEAMACGIPAVALKWSGSTEFAGDALLVEVKEFKKPEHVYGMPDCPGLWAEPDFEHFKKVIKDSYDNWTVHRAKALDTAGFIREIFSWEMAAQRVMMLLGEIEKIKVNIEVKNEEKKNQIFVIGCWPNSEDKMNTLVETINQVKAEGYPVLITSHYPLPPSIIELADYYIYDKRNELSGDWRATYTRKKDGKIESAKATIPYHAVAVLHAIRNAIDFCCGKFDVMHYMEYDIEFDVKEYASLWKNKPKEKRLLAISYEKESGVPAIQSCLFSGDMRWLSLYFPIVKTWEEYLSRYGEGYYVLEHWLVKYFEENKVTDKVAMVDYPIANRYDQVDREIWPDDIFNLNYQNGPVINISGLSRREYDVSFENDKDGVQYQVPVKVGTWASPNTKFFRNWHIKAMLNGELKFENKLNLEGKRVIIAMGSKALGDTIAWIPYFEEFRKKHNCHVIASGYWNDLFNYPEIEWTKPGNAHPDIYAVYEVGCFDGDKFKNPRDWRSVRMQEIATDILGLEYKEIRPQMKQGLAFHYDKPHVCFSEFSTMKAKLWNREGGWQAVVDYLNDMGYKVVSISKEPTQLKNVVARNNKSIEETIATLRGADFHLGLGSGPSWLAWALNIPVVMISGFSLPTCEFDNPYRIYSPNGCGGCFNDTTLKFDRGWEWCPKKNEYSCTREISPEMVIEKIEDLITSPKE